MSLSAWLIYLTVVGLCFFIGKKKIVNKNVKPLNYVFDDDINFSAFLMPGSGLNPTVLGSGSNPPVSSSSINKSMWSWPVHFVSLAAEIGISGTTWLPFTLLLSLLKNLSNTVCVWRRLGLSVSMSRCLSPLWFSRLFLGAKDSLPENIICERKYSIKKSKITSIYELCSININNNICLA